ncbi:MAG: regulatory signaling modulator protein AmpE [Woeseia sp.]|nr:regulatory signaling modulator protein AmpE [Woeseia sp.]
MKLIALLIGLLIERLATQLFHLRELRWLDSVIDAGSEKIFRSTKWPPVVPVLLLTALLVLPVFAVMLLLGNTLFGFPYLLVAIVVLFFSLGPTDIGEEVDAYCAAVEAKDPEAIRRTAKALLEHDVPEDDRARTLAVEKAVFVQANNRLFAVIFWFVLLGPLGAWSYRITDLIRRRTVFRAGRHEAEEHYSKIASAANSVHSWVAWVPARLTACGYALAGSFDDAFAVWRESPTQVTPTTGVRSDELLARVGVASLALPPLDDENEESRAIRGATAANRLVFRLLFFWAVVIAGMTLYGWSV